MVRRRLVVAIAPFALATLAGLVVLWPSEPTEAVGGVPSDARFRATVTDVAEQDCEGLPGGGGGFSCVRVAARLDEGPDAGDSVQFEMAESAGVRKIAEDDGVLVGRAQGVEDAPGAQQFYFADYQRDRPLFLLAFLFAGVVVALSRWRGLSALIGLGLSLMVLIRFVLPAILEGSDPVIVSIVGASVVMFVTLYLAHGMTAMTTTAVLGTLCSLVLTGVLAVVFVGAAHFTGLASEEAAFLQISAEQVNLRGLLLGGIIIGTLGVLDDVTVTQASSVWELHLANPSYGVKELYGSAVRIGRDHIASTVNTLVLAYAGASLPLLILFSLSSRPLGELITTELVAEEIVRTLVGSIGLVASVPITTFLAATVVKGERPAYRTPRAERAWREGTSSAEEVGPRARRVDDR
jgi:uncharacterized membrane protein